MIEVYKYGVEPVSIDGRKIIECYERAAKMISDASKKVNLWSRTFT